LADGAAAGGILQLGGMVVNMAGAYYQALAQKYALKSQSSLLRFQANMSDLTARSASNAAESIAGAAQAEQSAFLGQRGQEIAQMEASQGASGVLASEGSGAEAIVSDQVATEMDRQTLRQNAVRAVNEARTVQLQASTRSLFMRSQARQADRASSAIQPWMSTLPALLSNAGSVSQSWYAYQGDGGGGQNFSSGGFVDG